MSWFSDFKRKHRKCGFCCVNPVTDESAVVQLDCADGIHDIVVCEECLAALQPMVLGER